MKIAPVKFKGIQEGFGHVPPHAYYNSWEAFGNIGLRSTVSRRQIESSGYTIPQDEQRAEQAGWAEFYCKQAERPNNGRVSEDSGQENGQSSGAQRHIVCIPAGSRPFNV